MPNIKDDALRVHAARAKGKTVIITGGASGIGRETGLEFAKAGANVVIGDLNLALAETTATELRALGSKVLVQKTDVTSWDDQLSLFQVAVKTFGSVDIVYANAGIGETGIFTPPSDATDDVPQKPNVKTVEVDLIAVIYTARLALFYLPKSKSDLKALILVGSMASIVEFPGWPQYNAAKHGVVGLARSLAVTSPKDIKIATLAPWFSDTAILDEGLRAIIKGVPLAPVSRVAGAAFNAATDPDYGTHGSLYTIPDGGDVYRVPQAELSVADVGFYKTLKVRVLEAYGISE